MIRRNNFTAKKAILSDVTIMEYNRKGWLIETPIPEVQLQPNSVDLTLAPVVAKPCANTGSSYGYDSIDVSKPIKYSRDEFKTIDGDKVSSYRLMPGEFCLMASNEVMRIPNGIVAFVQGRSSIARLGIQVEQAGLIDAGFHGVIVFEVLNSSPHPVILYAGMRVAQVHFVYAEKSKMLYDDKVSWKYQDQSTVIGSKINDDPELAAGNIREEVG